MSSASRVLLLLVVFLCAAVAASAEIEFRGVFATSESTRVLLSENATDGGRWVKTGGEFAGFVVSGYDSHQEEVTLTKDGVITRLRLKSAPIKGGAPAARLNVSGEIKFGRGETLQVQQAVLFFELESTFPVSANVTLRLKPQMRPDGAVLYNAVVERREPDGRIETLTAPRIVARPGTQFSIKVGDFSISFQPTTVAP